MLQRNPRKAYSLTSRLSGMYQAWNLVGALWLESYRWHDKPATLPICPKATAMNFGVWYDITMVIICAESGSNGSKGFQLADPWKLASPIQSLYTSPIQVLNRFKPSWNSDAKSNTRVFEWPGPHLSLTRSYRLNYRIVHIFLSSWHVKLSNFFIWFVFSFEEFPHR